MKSTIKRLFSKAAMTLVLMLLTTATAWAEITGSGTSESPYIISTKADWIAATKDAKYYTDGVYVELGADIDFNSSSCNRFEYCNMHFDGKGHTIRNFKVSSGTEVDVALFKNLYQGGTISNLTIASSTLTGYKRVAGIVAVNQGAVSNCHVESSVTITANVSDSEYCGGIAASNGWNNGNTTTTGTITNCTVGAKFVLADRQNQPYFGGIVGRNYGASTVSGCLSYSTDVTSGNSFFKSIIGYYNNGDNITTNYYCPVGSYDHGAPAATAVRAVNGIPSGVTVSPAALFTHNTKNYYAVGDVTLTIDDANKAFSSFSVSGATYSLAADRKSATVTLATSDATVSAILLTNSGSCGTDATWTMTDEDGDDTFETLTISGTGAITSSPWAADFAASILRVNIGSTDLTISGNPFGTLADGAVIVVPTLAYAVTYGTAAYASKLRVALGSYLFAATNEGGIAAYEIANEADLRNLSAVVNGGIAVNNMTFRQTANIAMSSTTFSPIANTETESKEFAHATYDGGGYVISGLYARATYYCGLFGRVYYATIKNVNLMNPNIDGGYGSYGGIDRRGAVVGRAAEWSTVSNCHYYGSDNLNIANRDANSTKITNCGRVRKVTAGTGVTIAAPAATEGFTYDGNNYFAENATVTFSHDRTGYDFVGYESSDVTITDGTFTMPDRDVTVTATWMPSDAIALAANPADGNYWTTFYCGDAGYVIDDGENACAYTATYSSSTLTLHKLGKTIAKGEAVIIVADNDEVSMTKGEDGEKSATNNLHGVDVRTQKSTLGSGTFYVMGKQNGNFGFFEYTGDYMPARKAYLLIDGGAALVKGLTMVFEEEDADGIQPPSISPEGERTEASSRGGLVGVGIYDLFGRRYESLPSGRSGGGRIYIHNGRKEVLK